MPEDIGVKDVGGGRHLQLLIDAVIDYAIYMLSVDGLVMSWNSGAARLKGYAPAEIIGKSFAHFYTAEDRAAGVPQKALQTAKDEGRFLAEGWRVRKDGTRFWASVVIDAIRDERGELIGFAKVTRDITDRQAAQLSLLESERRYRRLVQAVVDYAIYQLDVNGVVATWNVGAQRIKGYATNEIVGKHFSQFYTEEDRAADMPARALKTAATEGQYEAEGWRVRKDGTRFWASVVIDAIRDDDGKLIGFAKVTRDITERYEAQQALKVTQEQLAASQKMEAIGQLSGGIAHDFNNLMMIVLGNLETVQKHVRQLRGATNVQRALHNAMRGAQRAAALTSRLLAFSRRQPLDPKPLDVNKFLSGAAEFLQRTLGETVELEACGKLTMEAANAFADDDYVRLTPEVAKGQYVAICVSDTGAGMPPDVLSHAFEPFFTTKEVGHGTGLGLSQVYGFVKQSGGHVKIYSEPGHGTTVKMYFPRLIGGEVTADDDGDQLVAEGEADEVVLVVEDDADVRTYLAEALRTLHYRVITTSSAQAALTILINDERRVDVLLTDVVMPGMNGRELGRRAQALRPGLPVLYMTGYSRNAVMHQGRLDEGVELLQKPVNQGQLATRIRAVLDRAQSQPA